jgi:hypothetical protein
MDATEIQNMAADYAAWVNQRVAALRAAVYVEPDGSPNLDSGSIQALRAEVFALTPDAARFALVAALIALVPPR